MFSCHHLRRLGRGFHKFTANNHIGVGALLAAPQLATVSALSRNVRCSSEPRLFPHIPHNAKSIIRILKFRRYARTRRATRHLNLVPPRSSARTFPRPPRRPLRVALQRRAIIFRRKPIRAPLVHVCPNVAKPVRASFRSPHRLRPAPPARGIIRQMLRRLVAPRKLFLLHSTARRTFPLRFRRQTISPPATRAQPLAVSHRIKPRRRHQRLLRIRKARISPIQRCAVLRSCQKSPILRVRHLAFRHLKRVHPNPMHRPLIVLPRVAPHQEPPLGNRHHPRLDHFRASARLNSKFVTHVRTRSRIHRVNPVPPYAVSGSANSQTTGRPPALPPVAP